MPTSFPRHLRTILAVLAVVLTAAPAAAAPSRAEAQTPEPSTGAVHAFLLASSNSSFEDFKVNYRKMGTVYPTYFYCDRSAGPSNGRITGTDRPEMTSFARNRGVAVLARFDCQHTETLHRVLTDPALRESTISGLMELVARHGYDGINLDFEAGRAEDRDAYTAYVTDLANRLHAAGKKLSIDVSAKRMANDVNHPRSALYDYPALAKVADHVFVMAWGRHWQASAPGPLADWAWFNEVVDYVAAQGAPERFVIGAPLYGFDWRTARDGSTPGTAGEYADLIARAERVGATPQYDAASRESHFSYTDPAGAAHAVWFLSAPEVLERLNLAKSKGLGLGVWRLGREDQRLWQSLG